MTDSIQFAFPRRARAVSLGSLVCLVSALPGCVAVFQHETRSATVTIWEKDSRHPVEGLPVQVRYIYDGYQYIYVHNRPLDADGVTDEEGRVVLPVADFKYGTIFKAGYARIELSPEQVRGGGSFIMQNMGTLNAEKPVLQLGLERPPN